MKPFSNASALLIAGLLSGCAATGVCDSASRDPGDGGLLGGYCGTVTGAYEQDYQRREGQIRQLAVMDQTNQKAIAASASQVTYLEAERRDSLSRLGAAQSDIASLDQELARIEAQNQYRRSQIATLQGEINRLNSESAALNGQIAALESQRTATAGERQRLQAQAAALRQQRDAQQTEQRALEGALRRETQINGERNRRLNRLQTDLAAAKRRLAQVEARRGAETQAEVDLLNTEIAGLKAAVNQLLTLD